MNFKINHLKLISDPKERKLVGEYVGFIHDKSGHTNETAGLFLGLTPRTYSKLRGGGKLKDEFYHKRTIDHLLAHFIETYNDESPPPDYEYWLKNIYVEAIEERTIQEIDEKLVSSNSALPNLKRFSIKTIIFYSATLCLAILIGVLFLNREPSTRVEKDFISPQSQSSDKIITPSKEDNTQYSPLLAQVLFDTFRGRIYLKSLRFRRDYYPLESVQYSVLGGVYKTFNIGDDWLKNPIDPTDPLKIKVQYLVQGMPHYKIFDISNQRDKFISSLVNAFKNSLISSNNDYNIGCLPDHCFIKHKRWS